MSSHYAMVHRLEHLIFTEWQSFYLRYISHRSGIHLKYLATDIKYKVYRLQLVDMLKYEIRQNIQIHMTYLIVNKFDP